MKLVQDAGKEYLGRDLIFASMILIHFFNLEMRVCSLVAPGTLKRIGWALIKGPNSCWVELALNHLYTELQIQNIL